MLRLATTKLNRRGPRRLSGVVEQQRDDLSEIVLFQRARVAKLADAKDLKSFSPQGECGFNSHPGHQILQGLALFQPTRAEPLFRADV